MSIYEKFCSEIFGDDGSPLNFTLNYDKNFNFGYDVVDAIADKSPDKRALVWCNTENEEHIFTFNDIKKLSNKAANVFAASGIKKGDRVLVVLKRHYEYWVVTV
ncbi:MAG: AMP-binding protein, partial [Firmicutes bacterium]|nr:AMP-binding protein [Bacillota bacterium]